MIKYTTLIVLLLLGYVLLTSCSDIGDPAVRLAMCSPENQ
jgi:hypothetical protein